MNLSLEKEETSRTEMLPVHLRNRRLNLLMLFFFAFCFLLFAQPSAPFLVDYIVSNGWFTNEVVRGCMFAVYMCVRAVCEIKLCVR